MSDDNKSTLWSGGLVRDAWSAPARSRAFLVGLVALYLLLDAMMASVAPPRDADWDGPLDSARELRERVAAVARAARERPDAPHWLLVGDSVLAGDVMAGRAPNWERMRVVDSLRAEANPERLDRFAQVALNGLLPTDALRVLRELDARDPDGRVAFVFEINPRYFSRRYATQTECTRPWLEDVRPSFGSIAGGLDRAAYAKHLASVAGDAIAARLPVWRFASRIDRPEIPEPDVFLAAADDRATTASKTTASKTLAPATPPDRLEGVVRILEHYRDPDLSDGSAQVAALREMLARLGERGRRAYFFATPLSDAFLAQAMNRREYGDYLSRLDEIVHSPERPAVRLVMLDDALFDERHFIDHCHLLPDGNRLLAINLLHETNVGLRALPRRAEIVRPEGQDQNWVWERDRGYAAGSGNVAMFDSPRGMAIDGDGRLVVADTGNHCIRTIGTDRQFVRTIAGTPTVAGAKDGPALRATLDRPISPCVSGDAIFFADGEGRRIRRLEAGATITELVADGPIWTDARVLRARDGLIYVLDGESRILEFDPATKLCRAVVVAGKGVGLVAFDLAPDGRIFVGATNGQIFRGLLADAPHRVALASDPAGSTLELWFRNAGSGIRPLEHDFPMPFDVVRMAKIADLAYIGRYDGILVQAEEPVTEKGFLSGTIEEIEERIAERIHLRFLRCADDRIYQWIKPMVYSKYDMENVQIKKRVSQFHVGSMAFDERTGMLHWMERFRSRLFAIDDGLWGVAKEGNGKSGGAMYVEPGTKCAEHVLTEIRPQRFVASREERIPREGPYLGMILGSSVMGVSDMVSYYSCARVVEHGLRDRFGYRDGVRVDTIAQIIYGMKMLESVEALETFLERGVPLDFVMIEVFNAEHQNVWAVSEMRYAGQNTGRAYEYLERVAAAAAKYDTKVIFLDNTALFSQPGEGIEPPHPMVLEFLADARAAGFDVIELHNPMLRDHLETAPWGSPPYWSWHAAPWAIDRTGELMAEKAYPILREHLKGRVPALRRPAPAEPTDPGEPLAPAVGGDAIDAGALGLFRIEPRAIHTAYRDRALDVFVDLTSVPEYRDSPDEATLHRVALSAARGLLSGNGAERRATRLSLTLAVFTNYDEYGQGVRDSARSLFKESFDRAGLDAYVARAKEAILGRGD